MIEQPYFLRCLSSVLLLGQIFLRLLQGKTYYRKVFAHMVTAGPGSIAPVIMVSSFAGMIFTIQTARELINYGAVSSVGGAFALAFCRELAPILTASIIAGQVGSAFAAELGSMQVTEQIDALYLLRTDPIDYLVLPRVIACCVMMPLLMMFSLVVGIGGGVFVADFFYGVLPTIFLDSVRNFLEPKDMVIIVVKGIVFGALVAVNGCSWGLTTRGGAREVGESATRAMVTTWIAIFMMDFIISLVLIGKPVI